MISLALLLLAAPNVHAIVVGVNTSVDEGIAPLSYADDDAARYAELLAPRASSLHVLAVLDEESQRLFPSIAAQARVPTQAELTRALRETFAAIQADRDAGHEADFHFVFVGHGALASDGEGYVSLVDGKLTRAMIFAQLLDASPARFNHLIVDACAAYHLLYRGNDAVAAVQAFVEERSMARYPNTGVLLATTSARETHEWARIRGGVFSHEVLSALAGGADVDGNASLSYAEVGAFIEAANAGVDDPRARVDFTLRPPAMLLDRPLLTLGKRERALSFAARDEGRFVVEDGRGVTVAELHKNGEQRIDVALVGPAPYRVIKDGVTWVIDKVAGTAAFASMRREVGVTSRSSVTAALEEGLFQTPFGKSYVAGYAARLRRDEPAAAARVVADDGPGVAVMSSAIVGGVAGVGALVAGGFAIAGLSSLDAGRDTMTAFEAERITAQTNTALLAAGLLGGGAVVAAVVGGFALVP
jgi:hypothetical protein